MATFDIVSSKIPLNDDHEFGIGDINFLLQYKLWSELAYLESRSWTVIGGHQMPSYDDPLSLRSWALLWARCSHGEKTDTGQIRT